ncbi:hypothetical protein WMY93_033942 [Mugilogobius chulae]|uniref:Integrase catalytic domain-containing protein n=1 Tax=Mugilogobius chulae TaxID=88201 RepID=A0AAW0MJG4_9GOBI
MFRVLENRYGNKSTIALEIIEELERIPVLRANQPRRVIELIQAVEKALADLTELGNTGAIKNPLVTKSIESKLPDVIKRDWLVFMVNSANGVTPDNHFESLLKFLKTQEEIMEKLEQLGVSEKIDKDKTEKKFEKRHAFTRSTRKNQGCIVCGDLRHGDKIFFCRQFKAMNVTEKLSILKKLGACKKCLGSHEEDDECTNTYLCRNKDCKKGSSSDHHFFLCPKGEFKRSEADKNRRKCKLTEEQEKFMAELSPEMAEKCRRAFSNMAASTNNTESETNGLMEAYGLKEPPVILMLLEVTANAGQKVGTLIDLASDTNYITHRAAERLNLEKVNLEDLKRPDTIELLISHREGRLAPQRLKVVGDLVLWSSPLGITVGGAHPDLCEEVHVAAHRSETHFARSMRTAAVKYEEVTRPREVKAESKSTVAHKEFIDWWKWESIGAACEPKCGGCRCGNCQPGGKDMTIMEEKELEIIKQGLTYVQADAHSDAPHWDTKYPWIADPTSLPNNRCGVEATFLRTERQLSKEPEWKTAYTAQVHEMLQRRAAVRLTEEMLSSWRGPVWYVSHLVAPNPHSVTTPVRLVWNSSQKFKGLSMNDILLKGPDVLNPIRAVLLRFRRGVYAALGDIKKMYNSVWLEDQEMHLHRFLWRDRPEEKISEYAITRVNIGDRPAGCIAQLAMRETAKLPMFAHFEEERRILEEDSYVDDILTSNNDLNQLHKNTKTVEEILQAGGFFLKPWVLSGQSGRQKACPEEGAPASGKNKVFILPNQMREEDNKALGVGYLVKEDKLYVMTSINFSKRKKKMRLGQNLHEDEVKTNTPNPLTRRELLSQVASLYDPIGLVTPIKQKGAILVRKAFQEARSGGKSGDTWDQPLSDKLREEAIELFQEYVRLGQITFHRSLTPPGWSGKPLGITFSDGSDKSYGAVVYFRWETEQGVQVRLAESKAKLTPLDQKGEPVKAEICGAVFATRLKKYIEKHSRMDIERWYHLLDSQTVLGAIQRDSYGYQTFFANRVGEIQKAGPVTDWWWIPGDLNIADSITRGASPEHLQEESEWQNGPKFLLQPIKEWPIKSAKDIAVCAKEGIAKLQRKAFSAAMTRAQSKRLKEEEMDKENETNHLPEATDGLKEKVSQVKNVSFKLVAKQLIQERRYSNLTKLVRVIAWVKKAAAKWKLTLKNVSAKKDKVTVKISKKDAKQAASQAVLNVGECEDALRDVFLMAQEGAVFSDTTLNRLVVFKDKDTGLQVCGGRIQTFNDDKKAVPILPYDSWISTLLAREAHKANHEDIAGTLLRMRTKAWVVRGRKLAKKVVDSCVMCRKNRARKCQQIMGDLPPERTQPARPFEYTGIDLFGPYEVRDETRKKVRLKVWGIIFCCMSSRAIHADLVSDQSTEGFLLAYQRFTALRGHPKKLWSDAGKNFIGAKSALTDMYLFLDQLDKAQIQNEALKYGTEWSWKIHPADSPHRNGAAEAAVKIVKRALHNIGGDGVFTWGEFQTFLYMAANLANERPIDARTQSHEDCISYITPNSLLLGRASPRGDNCSFDFEGYSLKRLRLIQTEVNRFWKKWSQLTGPNLFVRSKWHSKERNVAIGDIIWIADQNALRGQYKLARVVSVNSDKKGIVRDVHVRTYPSYPVPIVKSGGQANKKVKKLQTKLPSTILHRDVRRIIVLLPIEEQKSTVITGPDEKDGVTSFGSRTRSSSGRCKVKSVNM